MYSSMSCVVSSIFVLWTPAYTFKVCAPTGKVVAPEGGLESGPTVPLPRRYPVEFLLCSRNNRIPRYCKVFFCEEKAPS